MIADFFIVLKRNEPNIWVFNKIVQKNSETAIIIVHLLNSNRFQTKQSCIFYNKNLLPYGQFNLFIFLHK